jgi:DNA repair photolyase
MRPIDNPPNPWASTHVEWIDAPPPAELEVYHEPAKSILSENASPDLGFKFSLNPYRGCFHGCSYCLDGETRILLANGRTKRLADLTIGEKIVGTREDGKGRRYVRTEVRAHWQTIKSAVRVRLSDGNELVASEDHRFLTLRGWKYVCDARRGRRPHLASSDSLMGIAKHAGPHAAFGAALRSSEQLRVCSVERTGVSMPMFDITTGTGDFIANGVVSHNCYARPSHQYWDLGAGTDFERKIIVKTNAPEKLRETFMKKSWKGEVIVFSGNTDCYQPLEASYELTRRCLEVCLEFHNPVGIITKGALIRRDVELLAALSKVAKVHVNMSIAFSDDDMARKVEPYAPAPSTRFGAMRALADAGVSVGVGIAPIIPGLNDSQVAEILTRAKDNGANSAFRVMLRLPAEVKPVFLGRLQEEFPDRAKKVVGGIRDMRGGALYQNGFGSRMEGTGARWDAVEALFDITCRRLGLNLRDENEIEGADEPTTFRRPGDQLSLFG